MMLDIKTTFVFNNIKNTRERRKKKSVKNMSIKKTGGFSQKDLSLERILYGCFLSSP